MKKILFFSSILVWIALLIFIPEFVLRMAGYGNDYTLFHRDAHFIRTNSEFPQKYFIGQPVAVPEIIDQHFPLQKGPKTIRIACLGGSTTAGFPYEIDINFPFFIKKQLERRCPGYSIEVLNLGVSAINSHSVRDMLPQLDIFQPDLICIYMGHNEFYGAFGVASNPFLAEHPALIPVILFFSYYLNC